MQASIVIPTVDRRRELQAAVQGCLTQQTPGWAFEIVVVDNSRSGTQNWVLDLALEDQGSARPVLRYVHEPQAGLSSARNAGIAAAQGKYVVFLDDDETPGHEGWLAALISVIEGADADAAFGPVRPAFGVPPARYSGFIQQLYTRDLKAAAGADISRCMHLLGSGNSCFRATTCFPPGSVSFKIEYNATGGEDTELIRRLVLSGKRIVWVPDAPVAEFVPVERMSARYLQARRFAQGQMRSSVHLTGLRLRPDMVAFWMVAGAAQFFYHIGASLLARAGGRQEAAAIHAIQSYGGLGKVLWRRSFRKERYGAVSAPSQ